MDEIRRIIVDTIDVKRQILKDERLLQTIRDCVDLLVNTFRNGNKVLFCGNGGSASDAQHLAAELSGRFYLDRYALPAEALHCNTSYLTAVANDYSFEVIYSRLIKGIGQEGDIIIGLTTSGNSKNIINAFSEAREKQMKTIAFTGKTGGKIKEISDFLINIPSEDTPRVQESHITVGHIICQMVEQIYFKNEK